ncbi:MAG: AGE family epimerase/isomerase [Actinomycetota bacterium]|nr:AGE family epimerase/isomerase [Actinomycetota bacterium]
MTGLLDDPSHRAWLDAHGDELVSFAQASVRPDGGFTWLDEHGRPDPDRSVHMWVTARMTHVFALAAMRGDDGAAALADHGVAALTGLLRDSEYDGWFPAVEPDGRPTEEPKAAYDHAFVVLAASSAAAARRPGADVLLRDALEVMEARFWSEEEGRCRESWDRAWTILEPYRGANSNMHSVEAFLAAADVTGDDVWRRRALSIARHVIETARTNDWRLIEHFDARWQPDLDYNCDRPDDPFRPYGGTVGHWLEWARLLLHLEASLADPPPWLLPSAVALFDASVAEGWNVDGEPGFVYTVDWDGKPVVRTRMHWVLTEAIGAAAALARRTGEDRYATWYATWWDHARTYFLDPDRGSWHHELDPANRPSATVWQGKPDVYHAYQATLIPQLPLAPTLAACVAAKETARDR